ncbi:MAG: glycoside hydrolase [Candidatus Dojkabacteria bacterium]|nr:MAG: glycoside hydrolase [Candidatus Dojkabacteria bacterium]
MKILYISHQHLSKNFPLQNIGGMQRVSVELLRAFESDKEVKVIPWVMNAKYKRMGPPTSLFWIKTLLFLPILNFIYKPDVILHLSMVTSSMTPLAKIFIRKTPMLTINHGHDVTMPSPWYQYFWLPLTFKYLDGAISVSKATSYASMKRGLNSNKSFVIPNGIDLQRFNLKYSKQEAKELLSKIFNIKLSNDTKILLTVGRLVKRKGHLFFLQNIFPLLNQNIVYIVIGGGKEYSKILECRDNHSAKERIHILGSQKDEIVNLALRASDLFVMPNIPVNNDMEGFGVVILEANASETPAVVSDMEGMKDVVKDGINGYRADITNPENFAKVINDLVQNSERLDKLSKNSRKYVVQNFVWRVIIEEYKKIFRKIIDKFSNKQ